MLRKFFILLCSVLILLCLGGVYAWSTFVPPLRDKYGFSSTQMQLVFGTTIAVFTLAMTVAGRLQHRYGPRRNALLSALLFLLGYILAAHSHGSFLLLWLGIGVISGAAIGCGYVAALSTPLPWFPRHKGIVTGLAAAGFGAGAIVTTWCVHHLLDAHFDLMAVFNIIGFVTAVIVLLCALSLRLPPKQSATVPPPPLAPATLLSQPLFWLLVAGMWAGTFAGLLVIGNLKSIALDGGLKDPFPSLAISLFAVGNVVGRITWGRLYDWRGFPIIPLSLAFLSVSLLLLLLTLFRASGPVFVMVAFLIGFGFGACFVLYAAHVAARYGTSQFSAVYPFVFLAYGVAGITGPLVGGWLHDLLGMHTWSILIAALIVAAGMIVCLSAPRSATAAA